MYNLSTKEKVYALYGLLLGDGYLRGNTIDIEHTNKQRFYIKFLARWCKKNNIDYKIKYDFIKHTTFGEYMYSKITIKLSPPMLRHFKKFNRASKKSLNSYCLNRISVIGLLFWYLDDGCLSVHKKKDGTSRFAYLNTHGFSLEDNKKIQKMLFERFNIETRVHLDSSGIYKDRRYYRIYINATNFRKLYDMFKPYFIYIPKEFEYKFNMKYEVNRMKNSEFLTNNYNYNNVYKAQAIGV